MKSFLKSKTIFFNATVIVLGLAFYFSNNGNLADLNAEEIASCIVAATNIILRFMTSVPVAFKIDDKANN